MPKEIYKGEPEKKMNKVSIYLTDVEKDALLNAVGDKKLSAVLRSLVIDYVRRYKMSQR